MDSLATSLSAHGLCSQALCCTDQSDGQSQGKEQHQRLEQEASHTSADQNEAVSTLFHPQCTGRASVRISLPVHKLRRDMTVKSAQFHHPFVQVAVSCHTSACRYASLKLSNLLQLPGCAKLGATFQAGSNGLRTRNMHTARTV